MADLQKLMAGVQDYIGKALAPIVDRIKALEAKPDPVIWDGAAIERALDERIQRFPKPQDGKSVSIDEVRPLILDAVKAILDEWPKPQNGKDGPTEEAVSKMLAEALAKIPTPKDGISPTAEAVADLLIARLADRFEAKSSDWALDFERRAQALFQKAVDAIPIPKDGKDGINGVGWDDMTVEHDGKRTVTLKFVKGEASHEAQIVIPCVIDAGFYKEGMAVEQGDGVTHGGSYWIAQKDTTTKPEIGNPDWRLAVRRGRDAKSSARL
jgi:hypothetical protein